MSLQDAARKQIQANVLTGYPSVYCARLFMCEVVDPEPALAWLRDVLPEVSYEGAAPKSGYRLNLAFTHAGLKRLGVSDADLFGACPAFVQGLTRRARLLGDAVPKRDRDSIWEDQPLHLVVLLHADFADPSDGQRELLALLVENGGSVRQADGVTYKQHADRLAGRLEEFLDALEQRIPALPEGLWAHHKRDLHHPLVLDPHAGDKPYPIEYFGFREGVRNPAPLDESLEACREFVLASAEPLLDGGSYLVLRELHQDVKEFWGAMRKAANGSSAPELAERVIGRRRDGSPLEPGAPDGLSFVPGSQPSACPFASHVRRANPHIEAGRAANPRLIRRGLSYMDREGRCGLMFMAFMSDIEEQFEFIQKNWIQRANHVGQLSSHYDSLAGSAHGAPPPRTELSLGAGKAVSLSQFVTPGEGAYLFVPARSALERIAHGSAQREPEQGAAHEVAPAVAGALERAESVAQKVALIQGWLDQSDAAARFWRFVESQPRSELEIGPNLFVADPERVCAILGDDGSTYSVGEYMVRMRPSTGEFMLGRDACSAAYQRESAARKLAEEIDPRAAATTAVEALLGAVRLQASFHAFSDDPKGPIPVELRALIAAVLDAVVGTYFGLPGVSTASLAIWGRATARYHFRPFPDASDRAKAIQASQEYRSHVMQLLAEAGPGAGGRPALKAACDTLRAALGADVSEDDVARNLLGIVTGSLGATTKLFLEGLTLYLRKHAKGRKLDWSAMQQSETRWQVFVETLREARRGGPDVLYRRFKGEDGATRLAVLWVGGAQKANSEALFGVGPHGCPGMQMGIAMIEGMLRALIVLETRFEVEYEGEYEELRLELKPRA